MFQISYFAGKNCTSLQYLFGIWFIFKSRHVGKAIQKDYRVHLREAPSSKPCQPDLISRNWKKKEIEFLHVYLTAPHFCLFSSFRYEMVRVNETLLEPPPNGRGLYNYLWENVKFNFLFYLLDYKSKSLSETQLQIFSAFQSTFILQLLF